MKLSGHRYWLIGASEGLGRSLASKLEDHGCMLVLSARTADRLTGISDTAQIVPMDVTDSASVTQAIEDVGDVDGIIYCAGAYEPMTAQNWNLDQSLQMMDVNFQGAMRCLQGILPLLLQKNRGHIVLIGSLSAYHGLPGAIGYGASKAALAHLAENLFLDLKKTGVTVQLINPGFIKTRLTGKNDFKMTQIMTPDQAADHVLRAMKSGRFRTAFPRPFAWVFRLLPVLPDAWVRRLF